MWGSGGREILNPMTDTPNQPRSELPHPYPNYRRNSADRVLAGVCSGLAEHLGLSTLLIRLIAVVLCVIPPVALGLYCGTWALTDATRGTKAVRARSHRWLLLLAAAVLVTSIVSFDADGGIMLLALVAILGAVLVWRTYRPETAGDPANAPGDTPKMAGPSWVQWVSLIGGTLLTLGGVVLLVWQLLAENNSTTPQVLLWAVVAALALVVGFGVLLVPLWLRLWRMASENMQQKAAEAERQRISSRIHDSVLQTLALIQKNSSEPHTVAAARSQERQLRQWLFGEGESVETTTVMGALRVACGEVEDAYGVQIRPVLVGEDIPSTPESIDLVLAAREAMVNAAKHSGCSEISVYAELGTTRIEIFVRDRGPGFDLDQVPTDRHGVRSSIIERMAKAGGSVEFDTTGGTEVILTLPLDPNNRPSHSGSEADPSGHTGSIGHAGPANNSDQEETPK